jgi:hypothetical protein
MGKHLWVEDDEFAAAMADIFGDIVDASDEAVFQCVHDALVEGRDEWRKKAAGYDWKYGKHVTYRTRRLKHGSEGHIFSKKPGLPHLLEKGHAKIGGGRTSAYPHVKPAAEYAFKFAREHLPEYIARELR